MDNSNESDVRILGLSVVDHANQNMPFDDGPSLGTKRLHFDSESSIDNEVGSLSGYIMDKRIKMENTSEDEATSELIRRTSCDDLGDENSMILGTAAGVISSGSGVMPFTEEENTDDPGCVLIHHMNIRDPLSKLKESLEDIHGINLDGYAFYLQDTTQLEGHKNLVEQCVQGCGTVQINLQLKIENDGTKKINILDVLKPSDSYLLATGNPAFSPDLPEEANQPPTTEESNPTSDKNLTRWVVDHNFKLNQQRLSIPQDPMEWEVPHVRHWLLWAVRQFNLTGIKLADWKISGSMLCNLTLDDFKTRVPYDPGDIFWTHLELLRRCKFVAVKQNTDEKAKENGEQPNKEKELEKNIMRAREKKAMKRCLNITECPEQPPVHVTTGYRTGNNGQVQLWQFLLDLLTDKDHRSCIQWLGAEGEFKLIEPEKVALLWGQRKNKPNMNYEKLSRALRYYYDGDMIAKVHGKRFVYKFVCDLKQLLGYSAFDLNRLVIEAEMRTLNSVNDPIQHSIFGNRNPMMKL